MTARSSWKTHFLPGAAAATVICTFGSGHGCTGDTYGQPGGRDNDRAGHCAQRGESARSQHSRSRKHGSPGKHAPKSPLSFVKRKVKINSPFNPSGVTQGTGVRGLSDGCRRGWLCPSFSSVLYLDAPRLPPGMPARSPGGRALDRAFPECRGGSISGSFGSVLWQHQAWRPLAVHTLVYYRCLSRRLRPPVLT